MLPRAAIFRIRRRSLVRGILLGVTSFLISLRMGGFPDINALHSSRWQLIPAAMAIWSMVETLRCTERSWSLYYAGVLILLYTELMILSMSALVFFFP